MAGGEGDWAAQRAGLRLLTQTGQDTSQGHTAWPAPQQPSPTDYLHPIPLGSPSCCSSLDKDSPSTLCLAALERMKLSTATVAFTSPDSGDPW